MDAPPGDEYSLMALLRNMDNKLSNVCTREDMQLLQTRLDAHDEHFASLETRIAQIEDGTSVKITAAVEAAILTKLEVSAKNTQMSYSIRFSSLEIASNAAQQLKANGVDWIDPRTKVAINMRCRLDASAEVRSRHKALGRLWQALLNHMK
ncbi:unnamed protein product, partial [Prorocentrum cordatum]